jgi:hypothetical protein
MDHKKPIEKNDESYQKEHCNTGSSTDILICERRRMATASHVLCECVTLAEF